MSSDSFLLVTLSFTVSSTGLVSYRILNSTFLIFAGALLGAVFGLLGSVTTLMSVFERVADGAKVSYRTGRKTNHLKITRKILTDYFDNEVLINEVCSIDKTRTEFSTKVYPLDTSTKNGSFF